MNKPLEIALAKLRPFCKMWCAYLSYSEIVALKKDGYVESRHSQRPNVDVWYDFAIEHLKRGENGCTWVYYIKLGNHSPKFIQHKAHANK